MSKINVLAICATGALALITACGDQGAVNDAASLTAQFDDAQESSSASFAKSEVLKPLCTVNKQRGYNDIWGITNDDGRHYAFLGAKDRAVAIDITDAKSGNCKQLGEYPHRSSTWSDLKTYKGYLYVVTEGGGGLQIIDIRNLPQKPKEVKKWKGSGFNTSHSVYIDESKGILFAEGESGKAVRIIDINDPTNPKELSALKGGYNHDIFARDGHLYTSDGTTGRVAIWDYSNPSSPKKKGQISIRNAGYVHNSWLNKDSTHLMTTEETKGKTNKMFKLNSGKTGGSLVAEYMPPKSEDSGQMAHNTHIKGDYAYISHYKGGGRIVDVRNPSAIKEAAKVGGSGLNFWGAYPFYKNNFVSFSDMSKGLYVVEFTPK